MSKTYEAIKRREASKKQAVARRSPRKTAKEPATIVQDPEPVAPTEDQDDEE